MNERMRMYHGLRRQFAWGLALGVLLCCLFVRADPLDIPTGRTFDGLLKSLESIHTQGISEDIDKEVENVEQMIDRGRLLLVAGRVHASAVLAERTRVSLEIVELMVGVANLEKTLETKQAALHQKKLQLKTIKRKLDSWRDSMAMSSFHVDGKRP